MRDLSAILVGLADALRRRWGRTARRLRLVEREPRLATAHDIECLVREHAVPEVRVWWVIDRLASARLDPALVWAWTMEHDGAELAVLLGSALTDDEVVGHLSAFTMVDGSARAA